MAILETGTRDTLFAATASLLFLSFTGSAKTPQNTTHPTHTVHKRSNALVQTHRIGMVAILAWLALPSRLTCYVGPFQVAVKQWSVQPQGDTPEFVPQLWAPYSAIDVAIAVSTLALLFAFHLRLLHSAHQSMDPGHSDKEVSAEPPRRRVSFAVPAKQNTCCFRRRCTVFAVASFGASVVLMPPALKHAFSVPLAEFASLEITSDHVVMSLVVDVCAYLAYVLVAGSVPPGFPGLRFAAFRLFAAYSVVLVAATVLFMLWATDTLKAYIYTAYYTSVNRMTFVPSLLPASGLTGVVLRHMMTHTVQQLEQRSRQQTMQTISENVAFFSALFGDCVAILGFASVAVMPMVLRCVAY